MGTLALNGANTFGGAGSIVDIVNGIVSINSNASLGNAANVLRISVDGSVGTGLRATSTFTATGRSITLNAANNSMEVTAGNVLTIDTPLTLSAPAANAFFKNDNGVLEFTAANGTWTSPITVNGGAIRISANNALGSGALTTSGAGSNAYQLSSGITVSNPLNLTVAGGANGINSTGVVFGNSGTSIYSGLITQASGVGAAYGANAGATLNITGNIVAINSATFYAGAGGVVNLSGVYGNGAAGGPTFNKTGLGTLNVTTSQPSVTSAINVNQGTLTVSGSGVSLGITGLITVGMTGTLTEDDSSGAPTAHLGGRALTIQGGTFNYIGNAGASVETAGALDMQRGGSTFNITNSGTNALTFASLTNGGDSSGNFTGANLGTANNKVLFTTAPTLVGGAVAATNGLLARYTVGGSTFATYNTNGVATNTNGIQAFTGYNATAGSNLNINTAAATDTVDVTAAMTTTNITATKTVNAIRFSNPAGSTVGGAAFNQLTLTTGGILATGGGTNNVTVPVIANVAVQNIHHVDTGTTLNVSSAFIGTGGFVKDGTGTMILSAPAANAGGLAASANTITGTVNVSRGTLQLSGGKNTLNTNLAVVVGGPGATLDLNGTSQYISSLLTDSSIQNAGGIVTSGIAGGNLVLNVSNNARPFAGQITGQLGLTRSGQNTMTLFSPNTYTGSTLLNGGATTLQADGDRKSVV